MMAKEWRKPSSAHAEKRNQSKVVNTEFISLWGEKKSSLECNQDQILQPPLASLIYNHHILTHVQILRLLEEIRALSLLRNFMKVLEALSVSCNSVCTHFGPGIKVKPFCVYCKV
jgi:hypothetical protein